MSVIVVVKDGTRCCMACDSQASLNGNAAMLAAPKIVRSGELLIGADGTLSLISFARHVYPVDRPLVGESLARWVLNVYGPALRRWLDESKHLETRDGRTDFPGTALIARAGEFVHLDSAGNAAQLDSNFWAIGSASPEALGAMWQAERDSRSPEYTAYSGVQAAIALDPHCGGKITLEWTS